MSWANEWPRHRARLMAAAMQPVEKQAHDEQLWRQLAAYLSELNGHDDEIKCEFEHVHSECATEVTFRATSCTAQVLMCTNAAQKIRQWMAESFGHCNACKRHPTACWKVYPV